MSNDDSYKSRWTELLTAEEIKLCNDTVAEYRSVNDLKSRVALYGNALIIGSNILTTALNREEIDVKHDAELFIDLCIDIAGVIKASGVSFDNKTQEYTQTEAVDD